MELLKLEMKRLLLLCLILSCLGTQAQTHRLDTVIRVALNSDTAIFTYSIFENIEIISYVSNLKKQRNELYSYHTVVDGVQCDSSYVITSSPVVYDNVAYFKNGFGKNNEKNRDVIYLTKDKRMGKCVADYRQHKCSLLAFRTKNTTISIVNPATNESVKDIKCDVGYDDVYIFDTYTYPITNSKFLINITNGNPSDIDEYQLVDDKGNVKEIKIYTGLEIEFENDNYLKTNTNFSYQIRDHNMNLIGNMLPHNNISVYGMNIANQKIQCYYMSTSLNDADYNVKPIKKGTKVIIPYKFNPQLDIQMYRAYNDTLLSEADIEGLGKYELGILRNLLFAKHNYAFKSEFYQAYFNMYEFYKPRYVSQKMETTRKANVDNELTANDKANIALIRKMEAKLK